MKIFYYAFNDDGTVTMETLKARKNKTAYAVDAGTWYGERLHRSITYFPFSEEGKIIDERYNNCHIYSTTVDKVSQEMIDFNKKRIEVINQVRELYKSLSDISQNVVIG